MAGATISSPKCTTCLSEHRVQIDHILAAGGEIRATARRFGLSKDSVRRHLRDHVSDAFVKSVKVGPYGSEENLKKLIAEGHVSNLEALAAYRALLNIRILANCEVGADAALTQLIKAAHDNVGLNAKITGNLAPTRSEVSVSVLQDPRALKFVSGISELVRRHPAIRQDVMHLVRTCFADDAPPGLIDVTPALEPA